LSIIDKKPLTPNHLNISLNFLLQLSSSSLLGKRITTNGREIFAHAHIFDRPRTATRTPNLIWPIDSSPAQLAFLRCNNCAVKAFTAPLCRWLLDSDHGSSNI
jgi:hypothetical protein